MISFTGNIAKAYQNVFDTEDGKKVLGDLYEFCGADTQVFNPQDSHITAFNAGKHRVLQRLQKLMSHSEADISEIQKSLKAHKQKLNRSY